MDDLDAGDQSILRVLLIAITAQRDQRLQPSQVLKLVSGIKQSGIPFAMGQLEMSRYDLGNLLIVLENGAKT
jgi:hypothetical protein